MKNAFSETLEMSCTERAAYYAVNNSLHGFYPDGGEAHVGDRVTRSGEGDEVYRIIGLEPNRGRAIVIDGTGRVLHIPFVELCKLQEDC